MSGAEGPTRCQDQRAKRWHNKRMRKKGCNLGNKKLMNTQAARQPNKENFKKKGKTITSHTYSLSHGVITLQ